MKIAIALCNGVRGLKSLGYKYMVTLTRQSHSVMECVD